ncbi:MAG TPA: hypothetical protein VF780_09505 [Nitrosospira sp.]
MRENHPPLTCARVKQILATLGFTPRTPKENGPEQWVKTGSGFRLKVTLDCPKTTFTPAVIHSIANQAGVTEREFYAALRPHKPAGSPQTEPK